MPRQRDSLNLMSGQPFASDAAISLTDDAIDFRHGLKDENKAFTLHMGQDQEIIGWEHKVRF